MPKTRANQNFRLPQRAYGWFFGSHNCILLIFIDIFYFHWYFFPKKKQEFEYFAKGWR